MSDFRCYDVYLLRVDSDGDSLWARNYGHPDSIAYDDWGEWVEETADSGFIITGHNSSYKRSGYDVWLIKTDKNGDTCWSRTFGGPAADAGYSVKQCSDTGSTSSQELQDLASALAARTSFLSRPTNRAAPIGFGPLEETQGMKAEPWVRLPVMTISWVGLRTPSAPVDVIST